MATSDDRPARPTRSPQAAAKPRGGRGRFVRTPATAERDAEACRPRTKGHTYDEIATALGFADRAGARRAVERALLAIVQAPAAELRILSLARLDLAQKHAWKVLEREHLVVSNGRVVHDPRTDEPLRDDAPVLSAIDRVLAVEAQRNKLLGLNAPTRVEAITVDQIEAEITRLAAEIGMNDPAPAQQ